MEMGFLEDPTEAESDVEVGLTPLIDVVFQLLVFFMLTSTFAAPALDLVLPELSGDLDAPENTALLVEIPEGGELFLAGDAVALPNIPDWLGAYLQERPALQSATLRVDATTPYQRVLDVMHALSRNGIQEVHFVYEPVTP